MMVSFCCPHLVAVSALRMLIVLFALMHVSFMCFVKVCCVSRLTPRILLLFCVCSVVLSIWRESCLLCSRVSGVERVT